jgi:hypothetical protein
MAVLHLPAGAAPAWAARPPHPQNRSLCASERHKGHRRATMFDHICPDYWPTILRPGAIRKRVERRVCASSVHVHKPLNDGRRRLASEKWKQMGKLACVLDSMCLLCFASLYFFKV